MQVSSQKDCAFKGQISLIVLTPGDNSKIEKNQSATKLNKPEHTAIAFETQSDQKSSWFNYEKKKKKRGKYNNCNFVSP